jgi:hypothetical protein
MYPPFWSELTPSDASAANFRALAQRAVIDSDGQSGDWLPLERRRQQRTA